MGRLNWSGISHDFRLCDSRIDFRIDCHQKVNFCLARYGFSGVSAVFAAVRTPTLTLELS